MRVLTVRQPWAWAIVHAGKDVENRTRNIAGTYRGPVAIHAGLGAFIKGTEAGRALRDAHGTEVPTTLRFGAVIGVVDLVDVHDALDCWHKPWKSETADPVAGDYCTPWGMSDHHHLVLANPRPLATPIPATGRLGLWRPDDALAAAIAAQLAPVGDPLLVAPAVTSPDCRAGKCGACSGDGGWDDERNTVVPCACPTGCHGRAS